MAGIEQRIRYATTTDGVHIAYTVNGTGLPLIRVLNWLTHLEFEQDGPLLEPWLRYFGAGFQLVRYNGRGCGLSDRTNNDFSIEAKLRDLESVVDALDLHDLNLVGTSEGAATAIAYTAAHPERVRRLVLYEGTAGKDMAPADDAQMAALQSFVRMGWGQDTPAFRQFFSSLFYPDGDNAFFDWFNELQRISATPEVAAEFFRSTVAIDVRPLLSSIQIPTLVIHRRGDMANPFENGRALAAAIPGAEFIAVEGRNHIPLPGEPECATVFRAMRAFLGGGESQPLAPSEDAPAAPAGTLSERVFISYAHENEAAAVQICEALETAGVPCWIAPRDVLAGRPYAEAIVDAIAASRTMVVVFSAAANRSPHVLREVEQATSGGLSLVTVRLDATAPAKAMRYFLGTEHWLDAFPGTISTYLDRLILAVTTSVGVASSH